MSTSREKSNIERQQEKIKKEKQERENLENFRKKHNYTKEEIKAAEATKLEETKKRIWGEEPEQEKTETEDNMEIDLDTAKNELQKEFEREDAIEEKAEEAEEKKEKSKQEVLDETFQRIKKESEEKKHLDATTQETHIDATEQEKHPYTTQEGYVDATEQGEQFNTTGQEQNKTGKKFENLKQDELKQDLLTALDKPIENLVENDENIKKCNEKIWDLKKGLIKPLLTYNRRREIQIAKETAEEIKEKAKQAISDIEDEYIQKGFSTGVEIRKIIIEKIKELKGEKQEQIISKNEEHSDSTEVKEHFDATEVKGNLDMPQSEEIDIGYGAQIEHSRRDRIKKKAITTGKKTGSVLKFLGIAYVYIAGLLLKKTSEFVEEAGKGGKMAMPKPTKEIKNPKEKK